MKYYAMVDERLCGPFEAESLITLRGFTRRTLVQSQDRLDSGNPRWSEAGDVPLLAVLLDMQDRRPGPARFASVRAGHRPARRSNAVSVTEPRHEVVQAGAVRHVDLDGALSEFGRVAGRLEALEGAVRGVRTAVYCGTAVLGLLGLLASAQFLLAVRREPAAAEVSPAVQPPPVRAAVEAAVKVAALRPAQPPRPRPTPQDGEAGAAVELVLGYRLPASAAVRCPRLVAETRTRLGALARTPREASACAAMEGVLSLYDALVNRHGWFEDKAALLLDRVIRERGGLDAVFPRRTSARPLTGRRYAVELARRDALTPALSVLLDTDMEPASPPVLRYEADLDTGEVRPLGLDP